jgi:hypothetical protein
MLEREMMSRKTGFYLVKPKVIEPFMNCDPAGLTIAEYIGSGDPEDVWTGFVFCGVDYQDACYSDDKFDWIASDPLSLSGTKIENGNNGVF